MNPLVTPELGLIFWQAVTFLTVFFLLAKFAWKPIMASLKERESSIEDALSQAEKARLEMENLTAQNREMEAKSREEGQKIIQEAREAAETLRNRQKEETEKEVNKMLEDARKLIESEKQAAVAAIKNQVGLLSIEIAEKLIRKNLDSDASQKELVNQLIDEVKLN